MTDNIVGAGLTMSLDEAKILVMGGAGAPYRIRIDNNSGAGTVYVDTTEFPAQTVIDNAYNCEAICEGDLYKLARANKISGGEAVLYFVAGTDGGSEGFIIHAVSGTGGGVTVTEVDNTSLPSVTEEDAWKYLVVDSGGVWNAYNSLFEPLDYLESDGQSYIDTGILSGGSLGIDAEFQLASSSVIEKAERQYVFGTYSGAAPNVDSRFQFYYGGSYKNNGKNVFYGYGDGTSFESTVPNALEHHFRTLEDGLFGLDADEGLVLFTSSAFTAPLPIYLLACNTPEGAKYFSDGMRIFWLKIYPSTEVGTNPVRDFIPVRVKISGAVGMWDKVTNTFFPLQRITPTASLPVVTAAQNGYVLKVVNGVWTAVDPNS